MAHSRYSANSSHYNYYFTLPRGSSLQLTLEHHELGRTAWVHLGERYYSVNTVSPSPSYSQVTYGLLVGFASTDSTTRDQNQCVCTPSRRSKLHTVSEPGWLNPQMQRADCSQKLDDPSTAHGSEPLTLTVQGSTVPV